MQKLGGIGEKGIQPAKHKFTNRKDDFAERIVTNLHTNKVIDHLTDERNAMENEKSGIDNHCKES